MRAATWTLGTVLVLAMSCSPPAPATLDAHLSLPDARHVLVQGQTSLPDQAQILVTIEDPSDQTIIVQGLPLVKEGRFQTLVTLPGGLSGGDYRVRLTFSPTAFDWSRGKVPSIVGRKGEHLTGPLTKQDGDVTILQRDLTLKLP